MALSVKAYLILDPDTQEIRRFAVDEDVSANYEYLVQKVQSVFPGIRGKIIRLFWKDEDDELVTFSSDEELIEALGSLRGEVFRLFVKVVDGPDPQAENAGMSEGPEVVHPGVICDCCNIGITGTRFKCVICPDFDLCMKCESKGLHKEHEMLRICTPRAHPWFPGPFAHPPPPFCPPHHPHGSHHPPRDRGCGFGPWGHGRGGHFWGPRRGHGPWGGRGYCGGKKKCCKKDKDEECQQHAEKTQGGQEVPVGPPFLHSMGEVLASFLGPMGVEVHTYVDNETEYCQEEHECENRDKEAAGSGEGHHRKHRSGSSSSSSSSSSSESESENPAHEKKEQKKKEHKKKEHKMETDHKDEYVMVDKEKQAEGTQPVSSQGEGEGSKADEVPVDPLEIAIAQMRAMGFEDDGGWLSQLITAKHYDIGKVLDSIHFEGEK